MNSSLFSLYNLQLVTGSGTGKGRMEAGAAFCVPRNSPVFPLQFGCSSLKAHTFQEFPFHGKFLPERQIPRRFICNERQLYLKMLQNT